VGANIRELPLKQNGKGYIIQASQCSMCLHTRKGRGYVVREGVSGALQQHVFVCKDYSVCMGNIDQRIVFSDSIELSRTCHIGGFHFPTMY